MGRGNKNGRKIKRIFIFMCAELSDIPTGPCLGFYVIPGPNDDEEEEKHEFVHAPLLKSCHDDDDKEEEEVIKSAPKADDKKCFQLLGKFLRPFSRNLPSGVWAHDNSTASCTPLVDNEMSLKPTMPVD